MPPFKFSDAFKKDISDVNLTNNGHSLMVSLDGVNDHDLTISEGGLEGEYKLSMIHFHFGEGNNSGSEHTIDNIQSPAEVSERYL